MVAGIYQTMKKKNDFMWSRYFRRLGQGKYIYNSSYLVFSLFFFFCDFLFHNMMHWYIIFFQYIMYFLCFNITYIYTNCMNGACYYCSLIFLIFNGLLKGNLKEVGYAYSYPLSKFSIIRHVAIFYLFL